MGTGQGTATGAGIDRQTQAPTTKRDRQAERQAGTDHETGMQRHKATEAPSQSPSVGVADSRQHFHRETLGT